MTASGDLRVFAFDHRAQFEVMKGADPIRVGAFKKLCLRAAESVAAGRPGYGILCDARLGGEALAAANGSGLWIGRPAEWPGSRPLRLEPDVGEDGAGLADWPRDHVVKVLCFCHPGDDAAMWADQVATLRRLFTAARARGLDVLLEVIPSKVAPVARGTVPGLIARMQAEGLTPDWWKLEPQTDAAAWVAICRSVAAQEPQAKGILVLGLDASPDALSASFAVAARHDLVRGFAVGRTIFGAAARRWLAGEIDEAQALAEIVERFGGLCRVWDAARAGRGAAA